MSKGSSSLTFPRATPKGKEQFVSTPRHRVHYIAHQVEYSIHPTEWTVGMRVGVLEPRYSFVGPSLPKPIFYTGTVEKIWGTKNDIVTIKYDGHPYAVNISFGIENARFCIALPLQAAQAAPILTKQKQRQITAQFAKVRKRL